MAGFSGSMAAKRYTSNAEHVTVGVFSCARAYGDTYERALWLGMFAASALGLAATVVAFVNRDRA